MGEGEEGEGEVGEGEVGDGEVGEVGGEGEGGRGRLGGGGGGGRSGGEGGWGGGGKITAKGKRKKINLRNAPFHLRDGDTLGIKVNETHFAARSR